MKMHSRFPENNVIVQGTEIIIGKGRRFTTQKRSRTHLWFVFS